MAKVIEKILDSIAPKRYQIKIPPCRELPEERIASFRTKFGRDNFAKKYLNVPMNDYSKNPLVAFVKGYSTFA